MKENNQISSELKVEISAAEKCQFLSSLCDQFKAFVLDSVAGHAEHYDDHMEFLKDAMETFIELKNENME